MGDRVHIFSLPAVSQPLCCHGKLNVADVQVQYLNVSHLFLSLFLSPLSFSGIWHCYWEFSTLRGKPYGDGDVTISDIGFQTDFRVYLQLSQTWLIFSVWPSTSPIYLFSTGTTSLAQGCRLSFTVFITRCRVSWTCCEAVG